jgi:hypothetical protein
MNQVLIAIAILAVTVMPSWAADAPNPDKKGPMKQTLQQPAGMRRGVIPQHLLMMAYHKNLMTFAHALDRVARQADTVPREFALTAIAEMRRSLDEMEKYRAAVVESAPAKVHGDMQKMMQEHLVKVKMHLRELEGLAKSDRIQSQEVIKHLQFIIEGCGSMGCQMSGGKGADCRCGHHNCGMHPYMGGHGFRGQGMMANNGKDMQEMLQQMKAQDAQMAKQLAAMNRAPKDQKVNMLADIVTGMAQQHAAMTAHMEKMMQMHMQQRPGASMPPSREMYGTEGEGMYDDEDLYIDDADDDEAPDVNR